MNEVEPGALPNQPVDDQQMNQPIQADQIFGGPQHMQATPSETYYQQPVAQPFAQHAAQPFGQHVAQPAAQVFAQPTAGQPLVDQFGQPVMTQPMPQDYAQTVVGQPLLNEYGQPVVQQFAQPVEQVPYAQPLEQFSQSAEQPYAPQVEQPYAQSAEQFAQPMQQQFAQPAEQLAQLAMQPTEQFVQPAMQPTEQFVQPAMQPAEQFAQPAAQPPDQFEQQPAAYAQPLPEAYAQPFEQPLTQAAYDSYAQQPYGVVPAVEPVQQAMPAIVEQAAHAQMPEQMAQPQEALYQQPAYQPEPIPEPTPEPAYQGAPAQEPAAQVGASVDPAAEPIESSVLDPEPEHALESFFTASTLSDEAVMAGIGEDEYDNEDEYDDTPRAYMQNRELSWLTFDERVLDQGADESVPLLERLNFISIFWSNLQEFFMVRVGSLTDLSFIEPPVKDSKTGMTPKEQIKAILERCRELYPIQESYYEHVRGSLAKQGVRHLRPDDLSDEQRNYLQGLIKYNIEPFLSPQIINPRHPFPHLENGKLYILVRLDDEMDAVERKKKKKGKKDKKDKGGAEGVVLGLIPLPHQCERVIKLPGRGFQFILLEHAIEMYASEIFSMYTIKHTNVICVTRNADIDANQTGDEQDEDYREHMKRLLKQRARLAPVRLECERPLSPVMEKLMLKKLGLKRSQVYDTTVPLDLSWTWGLGSRLTESKRQKLSNPPFTPAWPAAFDRKRRIMDQVCEKEVLLSYPYESMDPFVQLLKEAAFDPTVVSIKITLYRLASQSQLAEALITAAENGKHVTALFELRARFDESNNIEWSQRFEQAGCNVIYGFRDYKVHSKICCITRQLSDGSIQRITQLGTGNYNEKTAKLYTDLSFITTDEEFGQDATEFFRNMQLENVSDNYNVLRVAPLQIKPMILENLDRQIALAQAGKPCGAFLKANSITDKDVIEKIAEASQAGVGITLFVRGICCLVPEVKGMTDNVRVVSIVGRLLEHSRIYCFGTPDDCTMYLSSADLMTRNLNKRVEIAWPIRSSEIRWRILDYIDTCLHDTAKLRELRPNSTYTPLGAFCELDEEGNTLPPFDAQAAMIERAAERSALAAEQARAIRDSVAQLPQTLIGDAAADIAPAIAHGDTPQPAVDAVRQLEDQPVNEPESANEPVLEPAVQLGAVPFGQPVADQQGFAAAVPETEPQHQGQPMPVIDQAMASAEAGVDPLPVAEPVELGYEPQVPEAEAERAQHVQHDAAAEAESLTEMSIEDLLGYQMPFEGVAEAQPIKVEQPAAMPGFSEAQPTQAMQQVAMPGPAEAQPTQMMQPVVMPGPAEVQPMQGDYAQIAQPAMANQQTAYAPPYAQGQNVYAEQPGVAPEAYVAAQQAQVSQQPASAEQQSQLAGQQVAMPGSEAGAAAQQVDFFDEKSRALEMPPKKKGFFGRFF